MFGGLRKKLNDVVKKFSKKKDEETEQIEEPLAEREEDVAVTEPEKTREQSIETTKAEEKTEESHEPAEIAEPVKEEHAGTLREAAAEKEIIEPPGKHIVEHEEEKTEIITETVAEKPGEEILPETEKWPAIKELKEETGAEIEAGDKIEKKYDYIHEKEARTEPVKTEDAHEERTEILKEENVEAEEKIHEVMPEAAPAISGHETKKPEPVVPKPEKGLFRRIFEKRREEKPAKVVAEPAEEAMQKPGLMKKITEKELSPEDVRNISDELKIALLESDVALIVAEKICSDLEKNISGKSVRRGDVEKFVKQSLKDSMLGILNQEKIIIEDVIENAKSQGRPATIVFLGFNGTGKTTTVAKVAHYLKKKGYNPLLAAGDTFRAASIEQIEIHAKNLEVGLVKQKYGSDSAAVIYDAREHAKSEGNEVVLADTAGRSHSNVNLMDELKKVCRVNNPDMKIIVLDSLTGNDIVEQAERFDNAVGIDAIILSKADVYERGGAALSASFTIKKPVIFLGVGQGYDDIEAFDAKKIVESILE